jgi:iron(III) transport system permease protein
MGDPGPVHGDRGRWTRKILPAVALTIGVALIAGPFLILTLRGLLVWSGAWPHPSLGNFAALFGDLRFIGALFNTLIAGVLTTILSLIFGVGLAFLVTRTDMPGRRWLARMNLLPFFLSPYAGAMAWVWLLGPHDGLLLTWTRTAYGLPLEWLDIYSIAGVIFVLTLAHTPFAYLLAIPALRDADAAFEDTARVHGATFWFTMRHITLPLLTPALSTAALVVFVASAGLLDVPLVLGLSRGIRFVPTEIYAMARQSSDLGPVAAFGAVVVMGVAALTLWHRRFVARRSFASATRSGYPPRPIRLGWPVRLAVLFLEAVYLTIAALVPLAVLLMVSLTRIWSGRFAWRAATMVNYDAILWRDDLTRAAIRESLILAASGATLGVVLAIMLAGYLNLGDARHRWSAGIMLSAGRGVPAICGGLGFLIVAWRTPVFGTFGLILIACVARFLPFVTRNFGDRLVAIGPDMEQMARTSGANWNQIVWRIVLPLLRPSMLAFWVLLFALFIRELGATILVYARGTETIPVTMVMMSEGNPGHLAALMVVQSVVLMMVFAAYNLTRAPLTLNPA